MSADSDGTPARPVDVPSDGEVPGDGVPRVVAMPWEDDDSWALVLAPDSDVAALAEAVSRLPTGLRFEGSYGDVEIVLVYRPETALVPDRQIQLLVAAALGVPAADVDARPWPEWLPKPAVPANPDEIEWLVAEMTYRMRRDGEDAAAPPPPDSV